MTQTNAPFDEAAARAWLEGPDPEEPGYTVAESLGIDESFNYETFYDTINGLVSKASETELLPKRTLLWLVGVVDGALITRDTEQSDWDWNDPASGTADRRHVGGVRLCSTHQDWNELTTDHKATGIDAAVAVLNAVHMTASALQLPDGQPRLNHSEAQELHEAIGSAIETGDISTLDRARELAAIIVSDTAADEVESDRKKTYTVIAVWDHEGQDDTDLIVAGVAEGRVQLLDDPGDVGTRGVFTRFATTVEASDPAEAERLVLAQYDPDPTEG